MIFYFDTVSILCFRKNLVFGKLAPKILICLCISFFLTLVVFLMGVERRSNLGMCRATGVLIHYLLLKINLDSRNSRLEIPTAHAHY